MVYRVRVTVRGCLSAFSARGYKNYLYPAGYMQIGAPAKFQHGSLARLQS